MTGSTLPNNHDGLEAEIGDRIKQFRLLRGMSLRMLAEQSGVSASFVSQLENGKTNASIASVRKLSDALGITPVQLFQDGDVHTTGVLRAEDRPTLPLTGGKKHVISLLPLQNVEIYAGEFAPGATTGAEGYVHGNSQEFFIVTAGTMTLFLGDTQYELHKGDSIEYLSSIPHRAENRSDDTAEVLWVNSPPSPEGDGEDVPHHLGFE